MYHRYNLIENMMLNIIEEGEEIILEGIEYISDPIQRFNQRQIYYQALKELEGKFDDL